MNKSKAIQVKSRVNLARSIPMVFIVLLLTFSITSGGIMSVALADTGEDSSSLIPNVDEKDNDGAGEPSQGNSTNTSSASTSEEETSTTSSESSSEDSSLLEDVIFIFVFIIVVLIIVIVLIVVTIIRLGGNIGKFFGRNIKDKLD